jgi:hypothetical protein
MVDSHVQGVDRNSRDDAGEKEAGDTDHDRKHTRERLSRDDVADLRTFSIRAYPVEKVPELRPGMSAPYLDWRIRG